MEEIRIVLADTDKTGRQRLAQAIEGTPGLTVVAQTDDGEALLALCQNCDLVVMDLILRTMDGLEVLDHRRTWQKTPKFLILSSFPVERVARLGINHVSDYLMLKPCKLDAVVKRLRQMAQAGAPAADERDLKAAITAVFYQIGIPPHIKGYQYLREAVLLAVADMSILNGITKVLYPQIAKSYQTTPSRVERAIRHAIEMAWSDVSSTTFHRLFSGEGHGKPTNSAFIARIADELQMKHFAK